MTPWPVVPLGEVAEIQGGIQKQPKRAPRDNAYPFLRVANVTARGLELDDVHQVELFDGELERYRLERGDLLVVEGNGSASQIGRAAMWNGVIPDAVHQNHLIRVRPRPELDPIFLSLAWNAPTIREGLSTTASSSSGLHTLSVAKLKRVELPLPGIDEQRRIVALIEDHLSRLDAGTAGLESASNRLTNVRLARLAQLRRHWGDSPKEAIGTLAETTLGKMLDAKRQTGQPTRYLRNINVRWGSFDLDDVQSTLMTEADAARFEIRSGDLMVCEGGEPGRCALWREDVADMSFQKALHRVRVRDAERVLPDFVAMMLTEAIRSGRCDRLFTGTTIKHLTQAKLRQIEIAVPDIGEQQRAVNADRAASDDERRLGAALSQALVRQASLRRTLLTAAFSGRLTGAMSDIDLVEELVDA